MNVQAFQFRARRAQRVGYRINARSVDPEHLQRGRPVEIRKFAKFPGLGQHSVNTKQPNS